MADLLEEGRGISLKEHGEKMHGHHKEHLMKHGKILEANKLHGSHFDEE
jgi:hypothetical protein